MNRSSYVGLEWKWNWFLIVGLHLEHVEELSRQNKCVKCIATSTVWICVTFICKIFSQGVTLLSTSNLLKWYAHFGEEKHINGKIKLRICEVQNKAKITIE